MSVLSTCGATLAVVCALALAAGASIDALPMVHKLKSQLPPKIDWRDRGVVGPVQNQGACGNPGIFASVDNIASVAAIANGYHYVQLSLSQFMTCMDNGNGCDGGEAGDVYRYLRNESGAVAPAGTNFSIDSCTKFPVAALVAGVVSLLNSEVAIANALVESGPVFVTVDATSWETYGGGILTGCARSQIDHAAVVVGYDDTSKPPYWILKNSWGTSWGEAGYIRISKGWNECGIDSDPMTVITEKL